MKKLIVAAIIATTPILANAEDQTGTAITIYSKAQPGSINPNVYRPIVGQNNYNYNVPGYAVVRSVRNINLPEKHTILKYKDVAAKLDPTTVQFKSLTDPKGTKVAEQNYQFDLVSRDKLLQKYIDEEIVIERNIGDTIETLTGKLMSTQGGLTILDKNANIVTINSYSSVKFAQLPGGLITKPTLVWDVFTNKTGMHKTEVSYQTEGITWWADYNLTYKEGKDANSGTVDFGSWVSILNQSGGSYNNAKLKLMAGDVQRAQPQAARAYGKMLHAEYEDGVMSAPSFSEKSFFEYHLYTLSRPATIPDNSTKQLELIPLAANVPVEKLIVYEGSQGYYGGYNTTQGFGNTGNKKVDVYLQFANIEEHGMGKPLPSGRIRVNQRDEADGSLEFIGENIIDHTARNEEILIKLGSAFDVVGERQQTNFTIDKARKIIEEEFEIKLRNQKKQKVTVLVKENLYRAANWEILSSSDKYEKYNANTIHYMIDIDPEEEQIIKYNVRYSW